MYCAECPQYSIRLKALGYQHTSRILPAFDELVSRDSIVDGDWLPATETCQHYLPCCQPALDIAENLGRFLVLRVHAMGMTLN